MAKEKEKIVKHVDVEQVLKSKNPRLHRLLPRFVMNYIKRTLHEDEMNRGLEKYKDVYGIEFTGASLEFLGAKVESVNPENVPVKGPVIVAANHPLGGLDGIALIYAVSRIRKDAKFLVNDILLFFKNFGDVFVPVNKVGKNSKGALSKIDDVYASDEAVLVFPAGLVSRKQKGAIRDLDWKKSFVTKAKTYQREVVPVFIEGKNTNWFYNLASFRKKIGIKANIEMFYLADEMFNQRGKPIRIHFGKPFSSALLDDSRSDREWAQIIKNYVYEMGAGYKKPFEEFLRSLPAKK